MKGFKEYMMTAITAQKTKKCPPGYRFSKKLKVCVPIGQQRVYYPFLVIEMVVMETTIKIKMEMAQMEMVLVEMVQMEMAVTAVATAVTAEMEMETDNENI